VRDARVLVALSALALALAAGLWHLPGAFRSVYREVGDLRTAGTLERQLNGARRVDVDTRVFVEAQRVLPADAQYAVVTGEQADISTPVTLSAVAPFAGYWLLPRRRLVDPGAAEWIVSYGGDLSALGLEYVRILEVGPGINIAEVRR
jgi:hypothetical protein